MAPPNGELSVLVREIRNLARNATRPPHTQHINMMQSEPAKDIAGMKELIIENATFLRPILHPCESSVFTPAAYSLIVRGKSDAIHAEVVYKNPNGVNIIFFRGAARTKPEYAVEALLEATMAALNNHYSQNFFAQDDHRWKAAAVPNGNGSGWYQEQ